MNFIPVNEPVLSGNEKNYLVECIDTGWISSEGPFVSRFEEEFSKKVGRSHGIAVTNGTAAIDVAVEALGLGPGDEIILPTFTIISCVLQIVRVGAIPIFVDCDPFTWNMDITQVEERITERTKSIMAVHIYGLPVDMDPLIRLCKDYKLSLIEDAAEMIGQTYKGRPCGSFGDISTVSFYPNKHITTGEGGMVLTNDAELEGKCRELRNLCFQSHQRFVHERLGWNLRMTNMQAALGVAQLEKLEETVKKKRFIGECYESHLCSVTSIQKPLRSTEYADNIYWVYGVIVDESMGDAKNIMRKLAEKGVGTRPFFYPLHQQPILKNMGLVSDQVHSVAERLYKQGFYLPSGVGLTGEQIEYCSDMLKGILQKNHSKVFVSGDVGIEIES